MDMATGGKTNTDPTFQCTDAAESSKIVVSSGASPKLSVTDVIPVASNGDNQYFFEDEIFRIDKNGRVKFGLVIETPETYSADEDDDFEDILNKGEVRVSWYPEGKEQVQSENSIALADRTLMPGDIVRRMVSGKDTQRGYCREINMCADVKILGTKYVIKNVVAERLSLIFNWPRDSAVCLDSWVGSTKDTEEKAILRSPTGARIEISSSDFYIFKALNSRHVSIYHPQVFYPGNIVIGRLPSVDNAKLLTPDLPLRTNKKGKPLTEKFTVESVYTDTVWVHWQCKALSEESCAQSNLLHQPNPCVTGEDLKRLKRLNLFESCMLQINDRNYLKYSKCDTCIKKSQWDKEQALKFKKVLSEQQKEEKHLTHKWHYNTSGHHFEKTKKKMSLLDIDKTGKSKKFLLKVEKVNSSLNKDRCQMHGNTSELNTSAVKTDCPNAVDTDWETDDDDDDDDDECFDGIVDDTSTTTTLSTCSSPSPRSSPKHTTKRLLKKRVTNNIKRSSSASASSATEFSPKDGDQLVTEALLVYSTVTVVWQDGSIEENIPSTHLYPIHHLDNHEFFPGDFVITGKEDSLASFRDYGVIQTVDHQGRIAHVKWFTTYTSVDEPKPADKGETEESVYDLKDHPDFQYRPGTMVIRVANFVGEDTSSTAGQIIDNYIDGRVKVWWVDGHISMCWPQDLFEVGQYDHNDWGHDSEDSWETESENSEFGGGSSPKLLIEESHILSNIERARVALARLEEILNISPNLQNIEIMRKLLMVYKSCRYLDRLLNTNFFHEDNFMGLIERVRKGGSQTIAERAQDRKNRLFSFVQPSSSSVKHQSQPQINLHSHQHQYQAIVAVNGTQKSRTSSSSKEYAPKVLFNISSTPLKCTHNNPNAGGTRACDKTSEIMASESDSNRDVSINTNNSYNAEKNQLLSSAMLNIEKAFEKTNQLKCTLNAVSSQDDSGHFSRNGNCDGSSTSYASSSDLTNVDANTSLTKVNDEQTSVSNCSIEINEDFSPELVCVRLCSLLKDQLVKCINDIREKYYKEDNINLSDVFNYNTVEDEAEAEASETVLTISNHVEAVDPEIAKEELAMPKSINKMGDTEVCTVPSSISLTSAQKSATSQQVPLGECFQVMSNAPNTHKFHLTIFHPTNAQQYYRAVQKEHRLLQNSLPPGVWVRVYEDRMDLLSVMIEGPKHTPYEDGMFFFDMQLGREYPKSPPLCHYISYCSDRLNPNLYEDGKVCVSLLGTWTGRDSEIWGPNSTLLQVIVSIQGLILVAEPYFNEAGYEKQKGTQEGKENSRMYNEMVVIKMVQATTKVLEKPPEIFAHEILEHFKQNGNLMYARVRGWMEISNIMANNAKEEIKHKDAAKVQQLCIAESLPEFPLVPASRGFCLTLAGLLDTLKMRINTLK